MIIVVIIIIMITIILIVANIIVSIAIGLFRLKLTWKFFRSCLL